LTFDLYCITNRQWARDGGEWEGAGGVYLTYAVVDVQVFDGLLVIGYLQVQLYVGVDETRIFSAHRESTGRAVIYSK